jgi:CRISPR-associated endonuclease Csn1
MSTYVLGLDLGPNSIGWALVAAQDTEEGLRPTGLLDTEPAGHAPLGARIFEAGIQNFDMGSKEASLNQARRQARAARKTIARRRARKRDTLAILQGAGLLPEDAGELERTLGLDPYELRAAALDRKLEPRELGRALHHLAQRRGFKSNRLGEDDKEEKGLLKEISRLEQAIVDAGHRTLGEHLHKQRADKSGPLPVRLRARQARMDLYEDAPRRTRRSMYEEEFEAILAEQERLWDTPPLTTEEKARLHRALFFQHDFAVSAERRSKAPSRANLHRAPGIHPCPYEPEETGCPKSDWLAQRFRILKEVQSLRLSEEHRAERPLTPEEVEFTVDRLSSNGESSFSALAKELIKRFGLAEPIEFNLARGGRGKIKGNAIEAALAKAFGKKTWGALEEEGRQALRSALVDSPSPEDLDRVLLAAGLRDETVRAKLCGYRPKDDGYLSFSKRALEKILPLMEKGALEHEAIAEAYPDTFEADGLALLPSIVAMRLDERVRPKIPPQIQNELTNLTNPIVRRALVEVRKVVNAIIREHGKPARIVVEMARNMKMGKQDRKEFSYKLNERTRLRERAREALKELRGGVWPRRSDVDRWILWEQQKHACPYCGKGIAAHEVANADVEVDHILPRWQSLDDSMNNKVLCCANCNAEKGDRTPVAWLGRDSDRLAALLKRTRACVERKDNPGGMPYGKIKRFETESVDADHFAQSQLNDTRYISKLVSSYLLLLFPTDEHVGQKRVQTSRGNLTAHLRRMWGLNGLIPPLVRAHGEIVPGFVEHEGWTEKVRVDHRHHAVDALVVALSSGAFMKRLQDCWRKDDDPAEREASFQPPWESLRADALVAIEAINVSHRPMRRRRGALHKETYYGEVPGEEDTYVTRKRLDELTSKMVDQIRDPGVRAAVKARLTERGWDGKKSKLPKDWHREELYLPTAQPRPGRTARRPHPIRRVRVTQSFGHGIRLGDKGHRFAQAGGNYCLQVIDADTAPHTRFRVVRRFDANQPGGVAALPAGTRLLGTLHRKDSVLVQVDGLDEPVLAVVQIISGEPAVSAKGIDVYFRDAKDSRPATEGNKTPLARIKSSGKWNAHRIQSVSVDPLGRILPGKTLALESHSSAQVDA